MHNDQRVINGMTRAGAIGYLLKNTSQENLIMAIRKAKKGQSFFSGEVTQTLLKQQEAIACFKQAILANLTSREKEILKLIAEGFSNTEIGDQLHISHRTVDTHRTNLMRKLEVKNIAGLIRFAFKYGIVE